jgi:hypothetical protein
MIGTPVKEKPWWHSKTVLVGILTTVAGLVPLVIELVVKAPATPEAIATAVGGFVLGAIQIVRRVWLDGTPATLTK